MSSEDTIYQEATQKLLYIEKIKQEICMLLDWLTHEKNSRMHINARNFDHACAVLEETIDDMFYEEIRYAKAIRDDYE